MQYTYLFDFHLGFLLDPEELLGNVAEPAPVLSLVALHSRQGCRFLTLVMLADFRFYSGGFLTFVLMGDF